MHPNPTPDPRIPRAPLAALALALAACGGTGGSGQAARAPAKSGDLWVIANPDDRASAPGAVLAYVNGLHAFVLDGNDAYLGMTRLTARKGEDGARILTLPGTGEVQIIEAGDSLQLRFPGGETLPLHKQERTGK